MRGLLSLDVLAAKIEPGSHKGFGFAGVAARLRQEQEGDPVPSRGKGAMEVARRESRPQGARDEFATLVGR